MEHDIYLDRERNERFVIWPVTHGTEEKVRSILEDLMLLHENSPRAISLIDDMKRLPGFPHGLPEDVVIRRRIKDNLIVH